MKDSKEVIAEFNEYVNMTASELEKWLKSGDSNSAGWSKDGDDGESVGHDSGRQIVEILKANPDKTPGKYTDEQLQHMRKVASYCKRHLAQESASNREKDEEEVKQTKSYISLKNWGHDFIKGPSASSKGGKSGKSGSKQQQEETDDDAQEEAEDDEMEEPEAEVDGAQKEDEEAEPKKKADNKRKKPNQQKGSNKKQETRKTRSSTKKNENEDEDQGEEAAEDQDGDDAEEVEEEEGGGDGDKSSKKGPKKGDTVSWSWGSGNPKGKVLDVKEDKATITTKNGNEVSRDGDPEDPAVILDAGKSKAIKSAHELN